MLNILLKYEDFLFSLVNHLIMNMIYQERLEGISSYSHKHPLVSDALLMLKGQGY